MTKDYNESVYMLRHGILYKSCPACSKASGRYVFYGCPEYFGYRHEDGRPYTQSLCYKCRGNALETDKPFEGYVLADDNDIVVPEIRILPMSKDVFASYADCKDFFNNTVPNRGNTYYFKSHKMNMQKHTLVLFQYSGQIVAYGIFESETIINAEDENYIDGYRGYYTFVRNSINLLEFPISNKVMRDSFLVNLSQTTTTIKLSYFPALMELLDEAQDDNINEENKIIEQKTVKLVKNFSITGQHSFDQPSQKSVAKDYVKAQKNQIAVGALGEELICKYEKDYLISIGLNELAKKVKIVSEDASLGYDIISFDDQGEEIHIEVKSKAGLLKYLDFFISDNEYQKLKANSNHFVYYVSHLRSSTPFLFKLCGDMLNDANIKPVLYRVTLDYEINELQ